MAASTLERTQAEPRRADLSDLGGLASSEPARKPAAPAPTGGLADLAGLDAPIERDGEPDEAPAPAAATPASAPEPKPTPEPTSAPTGGLADLAGLGATIERDDPAPDEATSAPAAPAEPVAAAPAARPAPALGGLADLAGLDTTIERDGPVPEEAPPAAAPPSPVPAAAAPIVPRSSRQEPRELPSASASPASGSEPDLDQILRQSGRDLTSPPAGVEGPGPGSDPSSAEGADPAEGLDLAAPGAAAEAAPAPIEIEPLRPLGALDPEEAHFGAGHVAQVVEAALRGMPADPSTLALAKRWQEIDGVHSRRYQEASDEYRRHKALEDMRAPDAAAALAADGGGGRMVRGGGLTSIARGLASLGRRGVQAKRRSNTRAAGDELGNLRGEYESDATSFLGDLFAIKARHYDDRLQEMGLQHGALNDAVTRYNKAFAAAPAAASFLAAVRAYGGANGLSEDDALAAAATGKAGPEVAAALATVKGATLADPAVDAARAGMREAEDAFSDTARRAQKDFESMLRFSTPDSDFDAEQTRDELISKVNALADGTKAPVAEDEDKAKLQERMRELADTIQRMIREMFERMFKAVTGAFGR